MIKLLLAVDGSDGAIAATRALVKAASWFKDPVHVELVTVHLPVPRVGGMANSVITREMLDTYYQDEGTQMLLPSRKLLDEAGVSYTTHILVGKIAETIVGRGDEARCQMIYMGTRGMTALSNMVMGSIATKVVHLALVPVVLVH